MKSLLVIALAILLSACGSTKLKPSNIEANVPHQSLDKVGFVVLLSSANHESKEFDKLALNTVKSLGFPKVLNHKEYVQMLIEKGLEDKIDAKYDLISLHKSYKELGNFLVIYMSFNWIGGSWHNFQLQVIDAKTSETLLDAEKEDVSWISKESEFINPMINLLKEWKNNSVSSQL